MTLLFHLRRGIFRFSSLGDIVLVLASMLVFCCLIGCIHRHQNPLAPGLPSDTNEGNEAAPPIPNLTGDAIDGIQVKQLNGAGLKQGEDAQFSVRVWYTLNTSDQALLSLNLDQFRNPLSCASEQDFVSSVHAKAGLDSLAVISRGKHAVDFLVGFKAGAVNGAVVKNGAVSFESSMWKANPRYKFLTRWFGTDFCLQFK